MFDPVKLHSCDEELYWNAYFHRTEFIGGTILFGHCRLRGSEEKAIGYISVSSALETGLVTLNVLDDAVNPTDYSATGSMHNGIWNPGQGNRLIVEVNGISYDVYNVVFLSLLANRPHPHRR